ncbi:hypothetical protein [Nonomuraea sp. B5E05]|uniref:hypothetical protein n=1 Tax=Nonomuraea sp. B5E05 TaxID=3153569 RepID=UPI003261281F
MAKPSGSRKSSDLPASVRARWTRLPVRGARHGRGGDARADLEQAAAGERHAW